MKQTKEDRLISEAYNTVSQGGSAKKTVKMSYGDFLAKYKKSIAKYTADFIDDDPDNEDEAEQMAIEAVIDDLEHQGIHIEYTDDTGGNASYKVKVDNMVCPLGNNELSQMVDKYPTVKMQVLGDAKVGNTINAFTISGPLKDVQSLASELSEQPGIEFVQSSEDNEEANPGDKDERTEVGIALKIFKATDMNEVKRLAQLLLKMHGQTTRDSTGKFTNPVNGPALTRDSTGKFTNPVTRDSTGKFTNPVNRS